MQLKFIFSICVCLSLVTATMGQDEEETKLSVGDEAPDFELVTFDDKTVKLSDRFGDEGKPVALLFSRANW